MALQQEGKYIIKECIGKGSYGDVFLGIDKETGLQVALKVIDLEDVEDDIEDIHKEITMLAGCRCKNITEYHGSLLKPKSTELMIVMELMACSVADLVQHGPLDEAFVAYVLHEVLVALAYLHSENRIHRDIKAANILLGPTGGVKISDFGVSGQLSGTMGYRRRTFVGTPFWMAPEVIESSEEGYTELADIWSLGITAMEMATGSPPYSDLHPMRVLFLIPKNAPPKLEGDFSPEFKDFVHRCMQKDPSARPPASELLQHPFVAECGEAAPEGLGEMVHEFSRCRRPVTSRRDASQDCSSGTLPGWDFGTKKFGRTTQKMGDTLKAAVVDRYMQGKPNASDATVKNNGMAPHHALSKGLEEAPSLSDDMQRDLFTNSTYTNGVSPGPSDNSLPPPSSSSTHTPATGTVSHGNRSRLHSSSTGDPGGANWEGGTLQNKQQQGAGVTSNGNASASLPPPYGGTVRSGSMGGVRAGWQQQGQQGQGSEEDEDRLPLPSPSWEAQNPGSGINPLGTGTLPANAANLQQHLAKGAGRERAEPNSHPVRQSSTSSICSTMDGRTPLCSVDGMQATVAAAASSAHQTNNVSSDSTSVDTPYNNNNATYNNGTSSNSQAGLPPHRRASSAAAAGPGSKQQQQQDKPSLWQGASGATLPAKSVPPQGSTGAAPLPRPQPSRTAWGEQGQGEAAAPEGGHQKGGKAAGSNGGMGGGQQQDSSSRASSGSASTGGWVNSGSNEHDHSSSQGHGSTAKPVHSLTGTSNRAASLRYQDEQPSTSEDSGGTYATMRETDKFATVQSRQSLREEKEGSQLSQQGAGSRGAEQATTSQAAVRSTDPALKQESMAVLGQVLLPSLRSTTASLASISDSTVQQLSQAVGAQLSQLEKMLPGSSAHFLQQLMVKLVSSTDPALAAPKHVASSLLTSSDPAGYHHNQGGALLPTRTVENLGPLGEFLLGQWQEEVISEQALLARGSRV